MSRAGVPVVNRQHYRGERRGLLAQAGLTLLCMTMAECLFHTLPVPLSQCRVQFKGFLSATSSAAVSRVQRGSGMTHLGGGTHAVSECALLCVCVCTKQTCCARVGGSRFPPPLK